MMFSLISMADAFGWITPGIQGGRANEIPLKQRACTVISVHRSDVAVVQ